MAVDLTVQMINATVEVDQPIGNGIREVGTGFLVQAPRPDGSPRVVLITADHLLKRMPNADARVYWRYQQPSGDWRRTPETVQIRADGQPLWLKHPTRDLAVMEIKTPPEFARAAIPLSWLADDTSMQRYGIGPGDEMMVLGYPEGYSANAAGFPILRVGRVASYPLSPTKTFPTFMIDARVSAGNSGGPVFTTVGLRRGPQAPTEDAPQLVTGVLTQQMWVNNQKLDVGYVTQAVFVREAIAMLDQQPAPQPPPTPPEPGPSPANPASARNVPAKTPSG